MNVLKWASYDSDFKPNTLDMRFRLRAKKGFTAYCSIIDKGQLLDFNSLKEKLHLDFKDFFRNLQLRLHFCQKIKKGTVGDPNKSSIVKIFSSVYKAEPMSKTITKLYRTLMYLQGDSSLYIKERWEKESGINISPEDWEKYMSSTMGNFSFFLLERILLEKYCSVFLYSETEKDISRQRLCGSQDANHFHIFWGCLQIRSF